MTDPVIPGAAPAAPVVSPIAPPAPPAPVIAAPVAPNVPAAVPAAPVATPAVPAPQEPTYMAAIRQGERRKTLKALGLKIGKEDDVDKAIEELSGKIVSRKQENKLLREGLTELNGEKVTLTSRATAAEEAVTSLLETEIAILPADKRDAVKAALQGSPAAQLKQLAALKALGMQFSAQPPVPPPATPPAAIPPATPPVASAPVATPPVAPIAAPVTSAPPTPGPVATPPTPADLKAQFKQLRTSNNKTDRMQAAIMAIQNGHLLLPDDIA